MIYVKYIGALLLGITSYVSAHSWIACADYRGDVNYYDDSKCFGYVRNWERGRGGVPEALAFHPKGYNMAVDTGFEHRPSENNACQYPQTNPISAAYTAKYPPPVYEQGGVYCLAWPTKNHAAATCTNQFIPDTDLRLFISPMNPSSDPSMSEFELRNINGVDSCRGKRTTECQLGKSKHQKGSIDCQGFQRAPKFCDNTDKAMGTGCFQVPSNLPTGRYTFQWRWEFNVGELYTSCWDVEVVAPGQAPNHGPHGTTGTPQSNMCSSGNCGCTNNYLDFVGGSAPAPAPAPQPAPAPAPAPAPQPAPAPTPAPKPQPTPAPQPQPAPAPQPQPAPAPAPSPGGKPAFGNDQLCVYSTPCNRQTTSGQFTVNLKYRVRADSVIVVDLFNSNNKWQSKGVRRVKAGEGLAGVTVKYSGLARGDYRIKSWVVRADVYDNNDAPWDAELDAINAPIAIGKDSCSAGKVNDAERCSAYSNVPPGTDSDPSPAPVPKPSPAPAPKPSPAPAPAPSNGKKCYWDTGCKSSGCAKGLQCVDHGNWSQCVEKDQYRTGGSCTTTYNWGCRQKGCCNPDAVCGDDNICRLPCMM